MGADASVEEKKEASILRQPKLSEASDLYWACRNGDLETVKKIIASTSHADINHLEPNGSTALHAASFFDHADVVRFLLHEYGVMRHRRNRHGLTAYEEAATDEIRELFHRSLITGRFCSDNVDDANDLFNTIGYAPVDNEEDENDEIPRDLVLGAKTELAIRIMLNTGNIIKSKGPTRTGRLLFKWLETRSDKSFPVTDENTATKALQNVINECITPSHAEYHKACELLSKYVETNDVHNLLRLYSLETPFYTKINQSNDGALIVPILFKLDRLKQRAFQGRSFRGLTMTQKSLRAYRWALKHKGSVLCTDTFSSTSVDENVARCFAKTSSADAISVLMVFDFPEKCDTAIKLFGEPNSLPCISEFEDEKEVLVLPVTFFHVTDIVIDQETGLHMIYLENVPTKGGIFSLIKLLWEHRNEGVFDELPM